MSSIPSVSINRYASGITNNLGITNNNVGFSLFGGLTSPPDLEKVLSEKEVKNIRKDLKGNKSVKSELKKSGSVKLECALKAQENTDTKEKTYYVAVTAKSSDGSILAKHCYAIGLDKKDEFELSDNGEPADNKNVTINFDGNLSDQILKDGAKLACKDVFDSPSLGNIIEKTLEK
ncbi:MAG TPA: hypothetical protein VGO50_07670 [Pyrinomonadaceae bacterium]|jgi:hypothetical protein|nr:hypothetical protein [Pyrinomonadaceae bacterium]